MNLIYIDLNDVPRTAIFYRILYVGATAQRLKMLQGVS